MKQRVKKIRIPGKGFKLVNFTLIVENEKLLVTTAFPEDIDLVLYDFSKNNPEKVYVRKNFGIKLLLVNRFRVAIKWEQIPGYSLWEKLA